MRYWVCLSVCSCAIETTFPLSNFKTKHIFGILVVLRKYEDHLGRRRHPKIYLFFYCRRSRSRWGARGAPFFSAKAPPTATAASQMGAEGGAPPVGEGNYIKFTCPIRNQ